MGGGDGADSSAGSVASAGVGPASTGAGPRTGMIAGAVSALSARAAAMASPLTPLSPVSTVTGGGEGETSWGGEGTASLRNSTDSCLSWDSIVPSPRWTRGQGPCITPPNRKEPPVLTASALMLSMDSSVFWEEPQLPPFEGSVDEDEDWIVLPCKEGVGSPPAPADAPNHLCCPITHEPMADPVVAADGFSYERSAIAAWMARPRPADSPILSPISGLPLASAELVPNHNLRSQVQEWLSSRDGRRKTT
mmetsp:Transcript_16361/g.38459  ORF Transcript_16361/g.38459 Transcript_16361/m.38459 type:complete len:250 (-) Transcript_16361:525-1274(-)